MDNHQINPKKESSETKMNSNIQNTMIHNSFELTSQQQMVNKQQMIKQQKNKGITNKTQEQLKRLSIQQKHRLKQQAKQLLLKQCYKMATNKYIRLIHHGSQGFTKRQWAVIHLNTAITLQFQDKLTQSLDMVVKSIQIDPTYDKAYYRRLLILQQLGEFQVIISSDNIVPYYVKNQQINRLKQQICERYRNNVGFDYLISKLQDYLDMDILTKSQKGPRLIKMAKDIHKSVFRRIDEEIQKIFKNNMRHEAEVQEIVAQRIAQYYTILKEHNNDDSIKQIILSFYQYVHQLTVKHILPSHNSSNNTKTQILLAYLFNFWCEYTRLTQPKITNHQSFDQNNAQYKLLCYCPFALTNPNSLITVLDYLLHPHVQNSSLILGQIHTYLVKIIWNNIQYIQIYRSKNNNNNSIQEIKQQTVYLLQKLINRSITQLWQNLDMRKYKKKTILVDSMLSLQDMLQTSRINKDTKLSSKCFVFSNLQSEQFVDFYRTRHRLISIIHQQQEKYTQICELLQKTYRLMNNIHSKRLQDIKLTNIFIVYQTLQGIQTDLYRNRAHQFQQGLTSTIQKLQSYFHTVTGLQQNIQGFWKSSYEITLKWMMCINIITKLSPTFYIKNMQTYKSGNNSHKTNISNQQNIKIGQLLQQLCDVQTIFHRMIANVCNNEGRDDILQNFKQVLRIYVQTLTILSISHPIFLNKILIFSQPISKIFAIIYINKIKNDVDKEKNVPAINTWYSSSKQSKIDQPNILQIQLLSTSLKLLYTLIVDVSQQQQQQYAQRMGVDKQEIKKAKKLQGENGYPQIMESIGNYRKKVRLVMAGKQPVQRKHHLKKKNEENTNQLIKMIQKIQIDHNTWSQIINQIIHILSCKDQSHHQRIKNNQKKSYEIEDKLTVGILLNLTQSQPSKFHTPQIIKWMLNTFNKYNQILSPYKIQITKTSSPNSKVAYQIGKYFCQVTKKINVNTLSYTQLQPISNILIYLIYNAKHELEIFQSFLCLINLSVKGICIPLEVIFLGMTEDNQYIVHAALELFNNVLVNTDFDENKIFNEQNPSKTAMKYWGKFKQIQDFVNKYYIYYKNLITKETKQGSIATNTNNYSHPFKIYCTLLSVLLVIKALQVKFKQQKITSAAHRPTCPQIQQFLNWSQAYSYLCVINANNGDISVTLFKLVLFHAQNKTLPNVWHKGLQDALTKLKSIDGDKWVKLQKYVK